MKQYYLKFGTGNPANFTGLTPTFTIFSINGVTATAAPGITESPAGSGFYGFIFGTTQSIVFLADGGANLASGDRYISAALDPVQAVDEKVGTLNDSIGSTLVDPTSLLGFAKRNMEFEEGNANFDKASAVWSIYSRGSSTLLATKNLTNNASAATKT